MKILSLDPSSTAVGWAIFVDDDLVKAGVLRESGDFVKRMHFLMECVREIVMLHAPDVILIEMHEGLPFARNAGAQDKKRSPAVTATLCHGQGMILAAIVPSTAQIEVVGDLEWTGRTSKEKRAKTVHALHPDFRHVWEIDEGLDAADAVGIAHYWLDKQRMRRLESVPGAKVLGVKIKGRRDDG